MIAAEAKLHLVDPAEVQRANEAADALTAMRNSLAAETAEAAKGVVGHSEFDKTLDKVGGTLFQARDKMVALQAATHDGTEEVNKHAAAHLNAAGATDVNSKALEAYKKAVQAIVDALEGEVQKTNQTIDAVRIVIASNTT